MFVELSTLFAWHMCSTLDSLSYRFYYLDIFITVLLFITYSVIVDYLLPFCGDNRLFFLIKVIKDIITI